MSGKRMNVLFGMLATIVLLIFPRELLAENADSAIFARYEQAMKANIHLPMGELVVKTALYFADAPYVAGTIDIHATEQLTVNLREFDCTTFVESCVALARTIKLGGGFHLFRQQLQNIRYRNGRLSGYSSRLHYVRDWIQDNGQRGVLQDVTPFLGGKLVRKHINFMSENAQLYKALKGNEKEVENIRKVEDNINSREGFYRLQPSLILRNAQHIRNGDVVLFQTNKAGLDFSHMGIAFWEQGRLTFIHASTSARKVITQSGTLSDYSLKSKMCNGISVVRPTDL